MNKEVARIARVIWFCDTSSGTTKPTQRHIDTAKEVLKVLKTLGYRLIPELKGLEVKPHSESIWCPHCGEEFGVESKIEQAHENQVEDIKKQIERYNKEV